jgi:hypothetical protein
MTAVIATSRASRPKDLRAAALAHRPAERRARPRGPRHPVGRAGGPGPGGDRHDRPLTALSRLTRRSCPAACARGSASPARSSPLVRAIVQALAATEDHNLREGFFLDVLRRGFSAQEARSQLDTAIDWGRYGELDDYDSDDEELTLESGAQAYL